MILAIDSTVDEILSLYVARRIDVSELPAQVATLKDVLSEMGNRFRCVLSTRLN